MTFIGHKPSIDNSELTAEYVIEKSRRDLKNLLFDIICLFIYFLEKDTKKVTDASNLSKQTFKP